jgi:hypothetical protein
MDQRIGYYTPEVKLIGKTILTAKKRKDRKEKLL